MLPTQYWYDYWRKECNCLVEPSIYFRRTTHEGNHYEMDYPPSLKPQSVKCKTCVRPGSVPGISSYFPDWWVILFWRVDRQHFLPCSPCHISIHVLFLTNVSLWRSPGRLFLCLMISHHLEVRINKTCRQEGEWLPDNAKKQSNTMRRLRATKKLLIDKNFRDFHETKNL